MKQMPLLLAQEAPAPQITEVARLARVLSLYTCPVSMLPLKLLLVHRLG